MEYVQTLIRQISGLSLKDMVSSSRLHQEIIYRKLFRSNRLSVEQRQAVIRELDRINRLLFFLTYGVHYKKMPTGVSEEERMLYRMLIEELVDKDELDPETATDIDAWPEATLEGMPDF